MQFLLALFLLLSPASANYSSFYASRTQATRKNKNISPASDTSSMTMDIPLSPTSQSSVSVRYWVNSSMLAPNSPVMLTMGGEGTANGVRCNEDMERHRAICVQVEHRFYGESLPPEGASDTQYFEGLNVDAGLLDHATILSSVLASYPTASGLKRPVVNFGGSYSGATATWLRQSYPSLTDGAVASSGVVDAVLEFTGFDEAVAAALDPTCRAGLEAAQRTVDGKFEAGEGPAMKKYFNATNLDGTVMGDEDFMYMLADGYSMIVQYGGKAELCDALEGREDEEAVEGLRSALFNHFGDDFGQDCYYDSECLKVVDGPASGMMGRQNSRSWRFQKCTEVAYLQSRPQGGIRSSLLTLSALESQCKYVFGATPDSGNALLNSARGGAAPDVTNVLSLSYSDDPWTAASTLTALSPSQPYCATVCDGCGHCGSGVGDKPEGDECKAVQRAFVDEVVAQARFGGDYDDPNHPGAGRSFQVKVTGKSEGSAVEASVEGFDVDEEGGRVPWGPLPAAIDLEGVVVDFSSKGGPKDLEGTWDADKGGIVWADGHVWTKL